MRESGSSRGLRAYRAKSIRSLPFLWVCSCTVGSVLAAPMTPGSILVNTTGQLQELTPTGKRIQLITVPHPENPPSYDRDAGGVEMDEFGRIYVANYAVSSSVFYTYHAYLSVYDPFARSWQHIQHPVATFLGNGFDGGIAVFGNRVVMSGYQYDFSTSQWSPVPESAFPPNRSPADLCAGQDGLSYGLISGTPRELVRVSQPGTFDSLRDLILLDAEGSRARITDVAVATDGTIFASAENSLILKYDADGTLLGQLNTSGGQLVSIAMLESGLVAASTRLGNVVVTDTSLSTLSQFPLFASDKSNPYLTIVLPEPDAFALCVTAVIVIVAQRIFPSQHRALANRRRALDLRAF
jgi:hypothetical protein